MENIHQHELKLTEQLLNGLTHMQGVKVIGPTDLIDRGGVVSFVIDGVHPHDVGQVLDQYGIAVRTGQHCTQPIMDHFQIPGTVRASFSFYNTKSEIDLLIEALKKASKMLA